MNRKANKSLKNLLYASIVALALAECAGEVMALTTTYEFLPDPNALRTSGGITGEGWGNFSIEGQFLLNVDFDAGIASFDHVDATYGDGWSLGDLFNMTELDGSVISDTAIDFEGQTTDFLFDIHLGLTFVDDLVHLTGGFVENVPDGCGYDLDAVAVVVPEPATLFLVGIGVLLLKKRN